MAEPDRQRQLSALPNPATPDGNDRWEWERFRFARIARAMVSGQMNPIQAAETVDAQFAGRYPFAIAARAASKGPQPGGIRVTDRQTWVPMTRVETQDEPLIMAISGSGGTVEVPADARFEAPVLQRAAEIYNPEWRLGKVILGRNGPTHIVGKWQNPLGMIRSVAFDGHYLWGLLEDDGFEMMWEVGRGALDRSIQLLPVELEGEPLYVDHLALILGGRPVQANLPALNKFWPPETPDEATFEISRATGWSRAMTIEPMTAIKETPMSKENNTPTATAEPTAAAPDPEAVESSVKSFLARAFGLEPKEEPKPVTADDGRLAKLEESVASVSRSVTELVEGLAESSKAAAEQAAREMVATIDQELDSLVRALRITPAERTTWRAVLVVDDKPASNARSVLDQLAAGQPSAPDLGRALIPPDTEDGQPTAVDLPIRDLQTPDGVTARPEMVGAFAQARALALKDADGDPSKYHEAFRRIALNGDPRITSTARH